MNLFAEYDFHEISSYNNGSASRLSPHELECAKAAARGLMINTKTSRAQFWGKVSGLKNDYIVIFLFNEDPLHEGDSEGSHYYISIDGARTFTLLSPPFEVAARIAELGTSPLSPSKNQQNGGDRVKSRLLSSENSSSTNKSLDFAARVPATTTATTSISANLNETNNNSVNINQNTNAVKVRGADGKNADYFDKSALPEVALGALRMDYLCRMLTGPFAGDPALEYRIPAERLGATTNSKDVAFCVREVERLACFVHEVNTFCSVVPRGAVEQRERAVIHPYSKIPSAAAAGGVAQAQKNKEAASRLPLKFNPHFNGLNRADAGRLSSYLHLRALTERVATALEKEGAAATIDCLEPLSIDEPATTDNDHPGAWTVRYEPVNDVVYGTSNLFPGAMFFHQPQTSLFGSVYIGDGMQSKDVLSFML